MIYCFPVDILSAYPSKKALWCSSGICNEVIHIWSLFVSKDLSLSVLFLMVVVRLEFISWFDFWRLSTCNTISLLSDYTCIWALGSNSN